MDNGVSAGEVGGIFAGIIALLASIGTAIRWLFNWRDARDRSQAARLKAWEESLDRREKEHRESTEQRLHAMERKLSAVTAALFETIAELQLLDAASPALAKAKIVLRQAYPLDVETPSDMQALIDRLDTASTQRG